MSKDLNQCNFIGRLGAEPEMKAMPNGDAVCNFTIAVGDDYKDKSGARVESTEWVRVVAFRRLAEVIGQYCKKGSKVFVSGKMKTRQWEQEGVKRYSTEIVANELQMLDGKDSAPASHPQDSAARVQPSLSAPAPATLDNFDDDIPF